MNRIYRKSPFWSLAGPLLGYLAIEAVIQFALMFLIEMPYMVRAYAEILRDNSGTALSMQEIWDSYMQALEPALEAIAKYQVGIISLAALGTIILTGILFARDRKLERQAGVKLPDKAPLSKYWTVVVFGVAGCIAATCLMAMIQLAFYDAQYQQNAQITYSAGLLVEIIGLGLITPVAEELMFRGILYKRFHERQSLMFRGILYKRFHERQSFWYSAVWSALLFSFVHSSTTQMIYTFLLGVLLSYLYEKFGSLRAPVLLHILLNTGSVIFTELGVFRWLAGNPMRMAGAVIMGTFICSVMFVLVQKMPGSVRTERASDDSERPNMFR